MPDRRFKRRNPCPICGSGDDDRRGQGTRCSGYLSSDGLYAHCTRKEYAGDIPPTNAEPPTHPHRLSGSCKCGATHAPAMSRGRETTQKTRGREPDGLVWRDAEEYVYFTAEGDPLFKVIRREGFDPESGERKDKTFRQWRFVGGGKWKSDLGDVTRVLYRLPELLKADPSKTVYIVEGEKCADYLAALGYVVTTASGGALKWHQTPNARETLRGRHVVVLPDNDGPAEKPAEAYVGQRHAKQVADDIVPVAASVRVLELPGLPLKGDVVDWLTAGGTKEQLDELTPSAPLAAGWTPPGMSRHALLGVSLADVEVEDIQWLWHGRVALGKITILDGDPGLGKSLFTIDLAARVAMGHKMPDGTSGLDSPAGVVLICGEDGLADTVKPRLLAAGASREALRPVRAIDMVPETLSDGTSTQRLLSLLDDLPDLESTITAMGARLLIIDPITAYLGNGVDMYRDSDLRRVLTPLAGLATRTGVAVILVRHLNKSTTTPALHRGLGGVGFIGVARLGLLFAPNPDAEGEVLVSRHKGNLGQVPPTLAYRIVQVGEAENKPRISWLGERETSAGTALASQAGGGEDTESRSATDEAVAWLQVRLAEGPQPAKAVLAEAAAYGISPKVLRTAQRRTCKKPTKEGMVGGWKWELDLTKMPSPSGEGIFGESKPAGPDSNGTAPKMPTSENNGHLRTTTPPKMPSEGDGGHLRTGAEFNGRNGHSAAPPAPKMPSANGKDIFGGPGAHEHPPADVAPAVPTLTPATGAVRRHCDYCGEARNFDDGQHCNVCNWQIGASVDKGEWEEVEVGDGDSSAA